jgi:hypothetical protein
MSRVVWQGKRVRVIYIDIDTYSVQVLKNKFLDGVEDYDWHEISMYNDIGVRDSLGRCWSIDYGNSNPRMFSIEAAKKEEKRWTGKS